MRARPVIGVHSGARPACGSSARSSCMYGRRPLARQAYKRLACRRSKIELHPATHGLQAFRARTA
eukprot:483033-Alexandrium_andersonii.AAC.1